MIAERLMCSWIPLAPHSALSGRSCSSTAHEVCAASRLGRGATPPIPHQAHQGVGSLRGQNKNCSPGHAKAERTMNMLALPEFTKNLDLTKASGL
jgi:hypothetical protein